MAMLPWAAVCLLLLPPISDRVRFPTYEFCKKAVEFNERYESHMRLLQRVQPHRFDEYQTIIEETIALKGSWEVLQSARCNYETTDRRRDLACLRERIGDWLYYHGVMPPFLPMWRFKTIEVTP